MSAVSGVRRSVLFESRRLEGRKKPVFVFVRKLVQCVRSG